MIKDGVYFDARLPHQWLAEARQSAFEAARFLHVLAAMEHPVADEPGEHEAKLDLQLVWLARLITPQLPPAVPMRIGIEHVVWGQESPLIAGEHGWLGFSPSATLPYLLTLPAHVVACEPVGRGHRITAHWLIHDDLLKEAFERMVFRHHREQIRREREAAT
ncbi:PilZ domain-containing protein [Chitinolyticbacter meiyuanensis]|uniref:PilZ domain-containing protein n=1 Tax=Chitinolyticbacter meiyuanensis TaxID=682798 RepID=UPI0016524274|nr:PilZ domain-containing protein [Chitinolyticbacter meiyuanensis]